MFQNDRNDGVFHHDHGLDRPPCCPPISPRSRNRQADVPFGKSTPDCAFRSCPNIHRAVNEHTRSKFPTQTSSRVFLKRGPRPFKKNMPGLAVISVTCLRDPWGWGRSQQYKTHPCMLPWGVNGDRERRPGEAPQDHNQSVRWFLKTAYMISPTRGNTGGVVFCIDFRMCGYWRTELWSPRLEEVSG
jgi:hypothetical protein